MGIMIMDDKDQVEIHDRVTVTITDARNNIWSVCPSENDPSSSSSKAVGAAFEDVLPLPPAGIDLPWTLLALVVDDRHDAV